ncbi:hypothetical protein ABIE33_006787, partial [Ensifer sp. 4252]
RHSGGFRSIFVSADLALCPRVFERGHDAQTEDQTYPPSGRKPFLRSS